MYEPRCVSDLHHSLYDVNVIDDINKSVIYVAGLRDGLAR